jgi:nucleoside-diphosphate-sugar epimerase
VTWAEVDLLDADVESSLAAQWSVTGSPAAVVSCVGVVGLDPGVLRRGNGAANANGFTAAKLVGVGRSVYVSVASELAACEENWLPFAKDEFSAYFEGKRMAEQATADAVGGDATKFCVIKPTFIYGGEAFELPLPGKFVAPRVSAAYGSGVEEVLSLPPIQALADAAPGLIKVALRPPVSVEAVATACASAALGELTQGDATRRAVGSLDGTVAIKAAAGELTPTNLGDGIGRGLDSLGDKLAERTEKLVAAFNDKMDRMGK